MICSTMSQMIGFECHPLSEDGSVAMIDTPFTFFDGDEIPVYVEKIGTQIRFFDDGGAIMHFMGRGVSFEDNRNTKFMRKLAEPNNVTLNDFGILEIWSESTSAPKAFAKYIATMLALAKWEMEQEGVATDTSLFIEEVAMCLRAWKHDSVTEGKEYKGISGHVYKMDLEFDAKAVVAVGIHPASVSSAAKKLLDIRGSTANQGLEVLVVIDDRQDAELAKREGSVLDSVASVMMMTRLEKNAGLVARSH